MVKHLVFLDEARAERSRGCGYRWPGVRSAPFWPVMRARKERSWCGKNVRHQQQAENNDCVGYNVMSDQYEDMMLAGILDAARAVSMAVTTLTVEVLVADTPAMDHLTANARYGA